MLVENEAYSQINVSGLVVGNSGIMFSGFDVAAKGRQTIPFQKNQFLDNTTDEDTNIQELLQFSGIVNEYIGFKKQPKRRFLQDHQVIVGVFQTIRHSDLLSLMT